ncbi:MAG: hypothetical protein GX610_00390 [Rhodococcus sp.]|nr:hypothetical protein [Rhodococcus sp. (in: high G+C Gram-positive bacteria)]
MSLIAPRLKKVALGAALLGVVIGAVVAVFTQFWVGVAVGAIVALPTALPALIALRRGITLQDNVIRSTGGFRARHVDVAAAIGAELHVRCGRVSEVSIRITDSAGSVAVPLALYTDDGGRELEILGLRGLADALSRSESVPAVAIASVLIEQLRAEARDAALGDRPLYRAVALVKSTGGSSRAVLTDHEVAELTA